MINIWLRSDDHLGHENTWAKFKRSDGTPLRPFESTDEMNWTMIENHNRVVKPQDKVYYLGDVVINKKFLPLIKLMNGHKRLVRGNHDIFATQMYLDNGFEEVYGVRVLEDMILSHVPLRESSITPRFGVNVHGHTHANYIDDPLYFCICVEQINYAPIAIEDLRQAIKKKRENRCYSGRDIIA